MLRLEKPGQTGQVAQPGRPATAGFWGCSGRQAGCPALPHAAPGLRRRNKSSRWLQLWSEPPKTSRFARRPCDRHLSHSGLRGFPLVRSRGSNSARDSCVCAHMSSRFCRGEGFHCSALKGGEGQSSVWLHLTLCRWPIGRALVFPPTVLWELVGGCCSHPAELVTPHCAPQVAPLSNFYQWQSASSLSLLIDFIQTLGQGKEVIYWPLKALTWDRNKNPICRPQRGTFCFLSTACD